LNGLYSSHFGEAGRSVSAVLGRAAISSIAAKGSCCGQGDDERGGIKAELALISNVRHMTFWDGDGALVALQDFLARHPIAANRI
jgi:hypothetical protein